MKAGFYDKLENELQGQQNTYYVGGLMAFELTERNSSYAMALVRKHFVNADPIPRFPYVKVLKIAETKISTDKERSLSMYLIHWRLLFIAEIIPTVFIWSKEETPAAR